MDRLPPEICDQICLHVRSNIDLKNLSLLNPQWTAATRPHLFRCIHVIPWPKCLARLEQSLEQPVVRSHARKLRLTIPYMPEVSWNSYLTPGYYNGLLRAFTGKEPWLRSHQTKSSDDGASATKPTREDWIALRAHCRKEVFEYSQGITQLQDGSLWNALKRAIRHPLTVITVDGHDIWTGCTDVWGLMEQEGIPERIHNSFGEIASTMLKCGIFDGVQEVDLQLLIPETLSDACSPDIKLPKELVETADRVYLSFASPSPLQRQLFDPSEPVGYKNNFLGSSTLVDHTKEDLQELYVHFESPHTDRLVADIPVGPALDCFTLRVLSLGGFQTSFGVLQGMLDNVRDTLKCLELCDIEMKIFDDKLPNEDTTPRGFFCALVETHRLKQAHFEDWFGMDAMRYDMSAELGEGAFQSYYPDEPVFLGPQIARAVVMEPRHQCFRDETQLADGHKSPTKEERLAWLRETFKAVDDRIARRWAKRIAEEPPRDADTEEEWYSDELASVWREEFDSEDESEDQGQWENMGMDGDEGAEHTE